VRPAAPSRHATDAGDATTHDRQLHFWLTDAEHRFLAGVAAQEGRSVGGVLRRLIQQHREQLKAGGVAMRPDGRDVRQFSSTTVVPGALTTRTSRRRVGPNDGRGPLGARP
jgi:hypothetical protein